MFYNHFQLKEILLEINLQNFLGGGAWEGDTHVKCK